MEYMTGLRHAILLNCFSSINFLSASFHIIRFLMGMAKPENEVVMLILEASLKSVKEDAY